VGGLSARRTSKFAISKTVNTMEFILKLGHVTKTTRQMHTPFKIHLKLNQTPHNIAHKENRKNKTNEVRNTVNNLLHNIYHLS